MVYYHGRCRKCLGLPEAPVQRCAWRAERKAPARGGGGLSSKQALCFRVLGCRVLGLGFWVLGFRAPPGPQRTYLFRAPYSEFFVPVLKKGRFFGV